MTLSLTISRVVHETDQIRSFELIPANGGKLPSFEAGAHLPVRLGNGLVRQYSLASDPADPSRYVLGIQRERDSRGGSAWIFGNWREGERVEAEPPANHFRLAQDARRHLLIAGGIGITPLLSMARSLKRQRADYRLIYCARNPEVTAFRELLLDPAYRPSIQLVHDGGDPRRGLDLDALLREHDAGLHVYVCGPESLIRGVRRATSHWPDECVHFEYFAADAQTLAGSVQADSAFLVRLASTGQTFEIPPGRSVLSVLEENGITVPKLCEEGVCGSCLTGVKNGLPDHRDSVQTEAERASNQYMALCCSRALSSSLELDL